MRQQMKPPTMLQVAQLCGERDGMAAAAKHNASVAQSASVRSRRLEDEVKELQRQLAQRDARIAELEAGSPASAAAAAEELS